MIEDNLNREVCIIDETGKEIGRINRTAFVFQHFNPFGVKPPEIIDDKVSSVEVERYTTELFDKTNAVVTPIVKWIVDTQTRIIVSFAEWARKLDGFEFENKPYITRQRLNRTPRYR